MTARFKILFTFGILTIILNAACIIWLKGTWLNGMAVGMWIIILINETARALDDDPYRY